MPGAVDGGERCLLAWEFLEAVACVDRFHCSALQNFAVAVRVHLDDEGSLIGTLDIPKSEPVTKTGVFSEPLIERHLTFATVSNNLSQCCGLYAW